MARILGILLTLCAILPPQTTLANWPARIEAQREAFREAWPHALAGNRKPMEARNELLGDYPLYPDLEAAWMRSQVGKIADDRIDQFLLSGPGQSSMARDLRYRWARSLAKRGHWDDYLEVYQASYRKTKDQALQCLALTARLRAGTDLNLRDDALEYWMHGRSRPDECDPVFDWLEQQDYIGDEQRRERIELALEERQFSLAAWLARSLSETEQEHVQRWRRMRHRPSDTLTHARHFTDNEADRKLVLYGIKRLARRDFETANRYWEKYSALLSFDEKQRNRTARDLAYSAAQNHENHAVEQILQLPPKALDDRLLEWGVRAALRENDWPTVIAIIDSMSAKTYLKDQWRYWRARALEATGDAGNAEEVYRDLAHGRGFYSFMAADRIEADYAYNHVPAVANDNVIGTLQRDNVLVRAREMFFVDLHGRARSEWDRHVKTLTKPEQAQSAIMASRWGWHSVAISTASRAGLRDDLSLRYPIAFREVFETNTEQLDLPTPWAFGIARSESLFMPDVASSAGAVGVMQLMPETGRLTARQARIRYRGTPTLLDPQQNIALGTFYLDKMYSRFGDHQVLATAAYNAGPHRVARWLPENSAMASDIWVETVPYKETRGYLRRVLAADAIFHWRLTGQTRRLAAAMPPVPAAAN